MAELLADAVDLEELRPRMVSHQLVTALPRNGLPEPGERPYVYRGTGADVLAGSYGDPLLDAPDDF
jgi:hypothetical protein